MTAAAISKPVAGPSSRVSLIGKIGVAVVALAASLVVMAAGLVLLSTLFSFPVSVPVESGEAVGGFADPLWWLGAVAAVLFAAIAIAAVVEAIRLIRDDS